MSAAQTQHLSMLDEPIAWKLRFLAGAIENMPHRDHPPSEDEYYGIMLFLQDIANMIDPPANKDGAA